MYNFEEDLIFNCLDFRTHNYDLDSPEDAPPLPSHSHFDDHTPYPHLDQYEHQKAQIEKLEPTGHTLLDGFPDALQHHHQLPQAQIQKSNNQRQIRQIFCASSAHSLRSQRIRGKSYETQNIGKHLKAIIISYLAMLKQANILNFAQQTAINIFQLSNGGFSDFKQLFDVGRLRTQCREFLSSNDYVVSLMTSTKMDFRSRLIMIKYAEKLRSLTYKSTKSWKMDIK